MYDLIFSLQLIECSQFFKISLNRQHLHAPQEACARIASSIFFFLHQLLAYLAQKNTLKHLTARANAPSSRAQSAPL